MQLFGVWAAVLLGAWMLVAGAALVQRPRPLAARLLISAAALSGGQPGDRQRADTICRLCRARGARRHADAARLPREQPGRVPDRRQRAAAIRALRAAPATHPARRPAIQGARRSGAGRRRLHTVAPRTNRYTYVDIDPAIRAIAQRDFLRSRPAAVRRHRRTPLRDRNHAAYDAVVVDVYSSRSSIPNHLVTREFWRDTRHAEARRRDAGQPDPRRPARRQLRATCSPPSKVPTAAARRSAGPRPPPAATSSSPALPARLPMQPESVDSATWPTSTAPVRPDADARNNFRNRYARESRRWRHGNAGRGTRICIHHAGGMGHQHYDPRQPIRSRRSSVQEADNQLFR